MEKSASALFDKEMMLNNVTVDLAGNLSRQGNGIKLTSDLLGQLAEKDLPKTIELLSQLYNTGELSTKTLSKMFTGRQAPYLIAQLGLIQGNITEYIDGTTKANKVSLDAEKAMENWTYQLKIARNTMAAFATTTSGFMDYVGKDMLKIFNAVTGGIVKMTQSGTLASHSFGVLKDITLAVGLAMASLRLGELTTQFLGLGKAVKAVGDTLVLVRAASGGLEKLKMLFTTGGGWMLILAAIAAIVVGITSTINRMNEASRQATIEEIKRNRELDQINKKMKATEALLLTQVRIYRDIAGMDWTKEWEKGYDIIGATLAKLKEFAELIDVTSKLRVINIDDVDLGIATKLTETIEEKVKDINIKLLEDKEFVKIEKKIEKLTKSIEEGQAKLKETKIDDSLSVSSAIGFNMGLNEEEFKAQEKIISLGIQKRVKLEEEKKEKIKQILQEEYKIYQQNELKKIKLSEKSTFELTATFFKGNKELLRSMKDTNIFDIVTKGTFEEAKTLIDYLKQANHEMTVPASELFNQRLELMSSNLTNINKQAETYTNYLNRVNQLYTDIRIEAFTNFLKINPDDIKGLDDYIKKAKEFKIFYEGIDGDQDATENIIKGFVKELENVGATQVQIDLMVKEDSFLTALSQYKALTDSVSNLKEGLAGLKKTQAEGGVTELSPEDVSAIWEANKENIIKSGLITEEEFKKQLENGEKNTLDFIKMIEALLKKAGDTNTIFFKNIFSTLSKEQKKALTDLFFYYDETTLRELKLQESQQNGLQQIETKRKILAEEMKMSKAKFDFDMRQLKNADKIGILQQKNGETEQEYLKNTLDLLIKRKEEVEKGGVLAEESAEYKDIEKAIKLVQDQQQKLNDEKVKGQEYTKDEKKIIEDTRKYYEELSNKYKELKNTTLTDNFDKLNASIQDSNKNISSQSDLMKILSDKEKELSELSISGLEIDDEKKKNLEKELETLKLILGIYTDITKEQEKSLDELDKAFKGLSTNIQKIFDSVKPEKSIKKQLDESYANLSKVTGKSITNEEEAFKNLLQVQKEVEATLNEISYNQEMLKNAELDDASKKAIEDRIEALKKELELKGKIVEETEKTSQKQKEYTQNLISSVKELSSFVTALTKGESIQFDTGSAIRSGMGVLGRLFASKGKETLHTKDYLALGGMAIGALDNVMQQALSSAQRQLEVDLEILNLRKQFASSEEEIVKYNEEILRKQKQQIDMQVKAQTSFLGTSGATGGFLEGAFSGAMAGAASGNPIVAAIGGVLGGIGGLFGSSQAEKEAKMQKEQLDLQYVANTLLEKQNKLLEQFTQAIDTLTNNIHKGINRAISESMSSIKLSPTFSLASGMDIEETFSDLYDVDAEKGYGLSDYIDSLKAEEKITEQVTGAGQYGPIKSLISNQSDIIREEYKSLVETVKDNVEQLNDIKITSINDFAGAINLIDETIESLDKLILLEENVKTDEQFALNKEALEEYKKQLQDLYKIYDSRRDVLVGSLFGFEIEKKEDESGKLVDIVLGAWKGREDIISGIGSSSFDVGQTVAESYIKGYNQYMITNNEQLQSGLDNIEESFGNVFTALGNISKAESDFAEGLITAEEKSMIIQENLANEEKALKNIIDETAKIEEEQEKVLDMVVRTNKKYVEMGGNLSDIVSSMTEVEKALYDVFASGEYTKLGQTIGEQILSGINDSLKDYALQIFSYEDIIKNLASPETPFDTEFMDNINEVLKIGEKFNDLTLEQIKDREFIKNLLISIGYKEEEITDELITQTQKQVYTNYAIEQQNESLTETLTLLGRINESRTKLNTLVEQYVTKLYDGSFAEVDLNTIMEERNKLVQMEQEERALVVGVMVEMARQGVSINEILSQLPQNLQDAFNTILAINYALEITENDLSTADQLWNSQVKSIRDVLKGKVISALYSEDIAKIDSIVAKIQNGIVDTQKHKNKIIDTELQLKQAIADLDLAIASGDEEKIAEASKRVDDLRFALDDLSKVEVLDLEALGQELSTAVDEFGNKLDNDKILKQIDTIFADRVKESASKGATSASEEFKTVFDRLNGQTSEFTKTLEFWFRGGQKLVDGIVTGSWSKTISEVNKEFDKMVELQNSINEDSKILMDLWADGTLKGNLSDIVSYFGDMAKTVEGAFTSALNSENYLDIASNLSSDISKAIADNWNTSLINDKLKDEYVNLVTQANQTMMSGSLSDIVRLSTEMQSVAAKIEYETYKQKAMLDLFNYNAEINYATQNTQVEYSTGTTKENVYNITYNTTVTTGAFVTDSYSSAQKVTDQLASNIVKSLEKVGKKL